MDVEVRDAIMELEIDRMEKENKAGNENEIT